ncbi:hypothetical protein LCGC14_2768440, partial [marine sediment metagenome]
LLVKKALNTADAIGKAADAIGISTDALQEYRHAAELSGVATGMLDKSLKKATRNIGDLGRSSSELDLALKELAPDLLANVRAAGSVEEALNLAFVAMSKMTSQTKRASVANAFFGKSGIDLTNIVRNGADAFREMILEARTLGLIIPEVLIRSAEEANDQLTRLTKVMKTQATVILATLSPQIIALGNTFLEFVPSIKAFVDAFLPEEFADVDELIRRIESLIELRRELTMGGDRAALEALSQAELNRRAREVLSIDKQIVALGKLISARRKMRLEEENVTPLPATPLGAPLPPDIKAFERAMKKRISLEQRAQRVIAETRTAQEDFNQTMVDLGELLSLRKIDWETYSRAVEAAKETLEEVGVAGADVFKKLEEAGETAFDNLSDALIEFGATGKFEWRDLARVALTAIRDIVAAYT